jgi:hypothetical protein
MVPWDGLTPSGLDLLSPNVKTGQAFSTPPVTMPAAGTGPGSLQSLLGFITPDSTVAAAALNPLMGVGANVKMFQVLWCDGELDACCTIELETQGVHGGIACAPTR